MNKLTRKSRILILIFSFAIVFSAIAFRGDRVFTKTNSAALLVPNLSATKTAALDTSAGGDVNGNGVVNPGDRLTYTVSINNTGADPATGVNLNDTIDANTTLVGGSVIASPIAVNDAYASIGNVGITVPDGASDLLANDFDANNPASSAALVFTQINASAFVSGAAVATTNGSVTVNSNGSFTYTPNLGFEGADTFTYTLSNGTGLTNTSTVTITVSGMIWFINNNAAACTTIAANCGRLATPFSTLAAFNTANIGGGSNPDNNDNIFIYESATAYSGAVTLRTGQKLIGQDATASLATVAGIIVPPFSNALPAMNSANGTITNITSTVTLNTNATLRGFSINSGGSIGINDPAGVITGVVSSEVNVATTTGTAILLSNLGGTLSFTKVSSSGAANGISLNATTGSFTVTGSSSGLCGGSVTNTTTPGTPATVTAPNTADCTGGTIQNSTSDGIRLVSVQNVSLTRMQIVNGAASGVFGTEVNGFVIDSSYVFNNGNAASEWGLKFQDTTNPSPTNLNGLTGSATNGAFPTKFINTTVRQSGEFNVGITNRTGTLTDLLVDGCQFTDTKLNAGPAGADGFEAEMQNTATASIRLQNSFFSNNFTQGAQLAAIDTATMNVTLSSSTIINNNEGFICNHSGSSHLNCTVGGDTTNLGNTFQNQSGAAVVASSGSTTTASASMTAKFKNNNVNCPSTNLNNCVIGFISGTNTAETINFSNNTVVNNGFGHSILIDDADATTTSPQFSVTANNNNVTNGAGNGGNGVLVQARKNSSGCVLMQNNTGSVQSGLSVARVRQSDTGTLKLKQGSSASNTASQVMIDNNPGVTTSVSGTITVVANGGCTTPPQFSDSEASTKEETNLNNAEIDSAVQNVQALNNTDNQMAFQQVSAIEPSRSISLFEDLSSAAVSIFNATANLIVPTIQAEEVTKNSTAPFSGETINKSLGTLPSGEQIIVQFKANVNANIPINNFSVSNTANITAAGGININSTTATTTVVQPSTVSKAFGAASIALNGTTSLIFTVGNANPSTALANVGFSDNLPAGLIVATPNGLVNNCGAGTITATAGASVITVSGLTRAANTNCTIQVNVMGTTDGVKNNTTTAITSTQGGTGLTSNTAVLKVITAPTFTKTFGSLTIPLNSSTSLSFSITNNSAASALNNVSFTDSLPAGLIVATPPNQTGTCGGGSITANAGANSISLSGATLAASANCTFSVDVTGTTAGTKNNSATLSTTELGGTSATANASVTVVAPPNIAKSFSPTTILRNNGFSVLTVTITNPAANTVTLTGVGVVDNFPSGIEVEATPTATNTCGGTFAPAASATSITLSGGSIPTGGNCAISVRVKGTSAGALINTTQNVTSTNGGTGLTASATLTVTNMAMWTGATSSNWNVATNWSPQTVPLSGNDVDIPTGALPNNPQISVADVSINSLNESSPRILTINSGRTLTVMNACAINGTMTVVGSFSCGSLTSSTGTINFLGAVAQTIPAGTYNNLTINNSAGLNLAGDSTINGALTFSSGNINTGANTLTVGASGSISRTSGYVIGNLRKDFGGIGGFTFTVGDAGGNYSPVTANATSVSAGANLTVSVTDSILTGLPANKSISRFWTLSGANLTTDLVFTYVDADVNGNEADYRVFKRESAGSPISQCASPCVNTATNTINVSGVSSFSEWGAGEAFAPTAASVNVSGRVVTAEGRGISKAVVTITDSTGNVRYALTNPFGYYRFGDLGAGQIYVVSVKSKRHEFASPTMVLQLNDELNSLNFTALP